MRQRVEVARTIPSDTSEADRAWILETDCRDVRVRARDLMRRDPRWKVLVPLAVIPGEEPGSYIVRIILSTDEGRMGQPWDGNEEAT